MSRNTLRAAAVITVAALLTGTTVTTAFGATGSEEVSPPTPIDSPTGTYIVLLEEDPVATYDGGEPGLRATTPADGEKLDTQSAEVQSTPANPVLHCDSKCPPGQEIAVVMLEVALVVASQAKASSAPG